MIKYITIITLIFSINSFSQKNNDKTKKQNSEISNLNEELPKKSASIIEMQKIEILKLKSIIQKTNEHYLKESFDELFTDKYFETRDLSINNDKENFILSGVLINSMEIEANEKEQKTCEIAKSFNSNYLALLEIRENVLNKKFDELKVNESIDRINKLPQLDAKSKLNNRKSSILGLLTTYKENTCALRKKLDEYREKKDQGAISSLYDKLGKDEKFRDYPYLLDVIAKIKKDVTSYKGDNDLISCVQETVVKENIEIQDKKEDIKETNKEDDKVKKEAPKELKQEDNK
ncbi:hypothetical protein FLGE108171_14615 [Flavobacterium gelidilacus]|uniref:hypothetical protein n=1 Tax=Flavobacterium gelidilacus TaxID=206041 RepID=UPI000417789C|nr:hypothetical protein [Flavobacterium gelidilacus]